MKDASPRPASWRGAALTSGLGQRLAVAAALSVVLWLAVWWSLA